MALDIYFNQFLLNIYYKDKVSKKKSKGIDRVSQEAFLGKLEKEIDLVYYKIKSNSYRFSPYLEELRVKSRKVKPRLICIPTIRDRLVLEGLKNALQEYFPSAVRRQVASIHIHEISKTLRKKEYLNYLKIDISNYYDSIDHDKLLEKINKQLPGPIFDLIKKAIINPTVPKDCLSEEIRNYIPSIGIPQGIPISNILSEIFLQEFDAIYNGIDSIKYYRYVDDILILYNGEFQYKTIESHLESMNLAINPDKLQYGDIAGGFNYLGYFLNDSLISIQEAKVQGFIQKIAGKITWFKRGLEKPSSRPSWMIEDGVFIEAFIEEINEKITGAISGSKGYGWIFYYKETTDMNQLFKIDNVIGTFFERLSIFDYKKPKGLKSIVRAYHEAKYRGLASNYVFNYNLVDTVRKKWSWLVKRGIIDENGIYLDGYIEDMFELYRDKKLKGLGKDEKDLTDGY
jgi:retron-type reverse transcriptase